MAHYHQVRLLFLTTHSATMLIIEILIKLTLEGKMLPDLWSLYELMLKSRLFEDVVTELWHDGLISGEMHLGTGEEAIVAGIVSQLVDGDAMALDHRGTPPMIMRGIDPGSILSELLGKPDGLCGGLGGHMHLFSKEHLVASSGIVGAAGPTGAGFALAAQYLRPGAVAVSFFGEGAFNQGMLMESMNLASVWRLPVIFVCKDDQWAITTRSDNMTGGDLCQRARGLGVTAIQTDGRDVLQVQQAAKKALDLARSGNGPIFLHATCVHFEAHFLGYQLLRILRNPLRELPGIITPLMRSFLQYRGAPLRQRLDGLWIVISAILATMRHPRRKLLFDPITNARTILQEDARRLMALEARVKQEISEVQMVALQDGLS